METAPIFWCLRALFKEVKRAVSIREGSTVSTKLETRNT